MTSLLTVSQSMDLHFPVCSVVLDLKDPTLACRERERVGGRYRERGREREREEGRGERERERERRGEGEVERCRGREERDAVNIDLINLNGSSSIT